MLLLRFLPPAVKSKKTLFKYVFILNSAQCNFALQWYCAWQHPQVETQACANTFGKNPFGFVVGHALPWHPKLT
jgi:hypothetical protein